MKCLSSPRSPAVLFIVAGVCALAACREPRTFRGVEDLDADGNGDQSDANGQGGAGGSYAKGGAGGEGGSNATQPQTGGMAATGGAGTPGAGGAPGSGGATGSGGAQNTAGAGGVAPTCTPKAEDCFNGTDDDCDTQVDCADKDCEPGAVCTPSPSDGKPALLLPAGVTCPTNVTWSSKRSVNSGLQAPSTCPGCSCQVSNVTCKASLFLYAISVAECEADTALTGGSKANHKPLRFLSQTPEYADCEPVSNQAGTAYPKGVRLASLELTAQCGSSGSPQPPPPSWDSSGVLCESSQSGAGCASGAACVPKVSAGKWVSIPQGGSCGGSLSNRQTWYTGLNDGRTCAPCNCSLVGGNCSGVSVSIADDFGCFGTYATRLSVAIPKLCGTIAYQPAAALSGEVGGVPTCSASSQTAGAASPTGPIVVCAE